MCVSIETQDDGEDFSYSPLHQQPYCSDTSLLKSRGDFRLLRGKIPSPFKVSSGNTRGLLMPREVSGFRDTKEFWSGWSGSGVMMSGDPVAIMP